MQLYVNRRIRDKAMVLGLPAERFMVCLGLICAPVLIVMFVPVLIVLWIPWGYGAYWFFRNYERLSRKRNYGKRLPAHLHNR